MTSFLYLKFLLQNVGTLAGGCWDFQLHLDHLQVSIIKQDDKFLNDILEKEFKKIQCKDQC